MKVTKKYPRARSILTRLYFPCSQLRMASARMAASIAEHEGGLSRTLTQQHAKPGSCRAYCEHHGPGDGYLGVCSMASAEICSSGLA